MNSNKSKPTKAENSVYNFFFNIIEGKSPAETPITIRNQLLDLNLNYGKGW